MGTLGKRKTKRQFRVTFIEINMLCLTINSIYEIYFLHKLSAYLKYQIIIGNFKIIS